MDVSNLSRVVECIAQTTRYPSELLTPNADLENDLGIDSVKRLEIVVALSDEFGLRLDLEERDSSIRTIEQVAIWVETIARREGAQEEPAAISKVSSVESSTAAGKDIPTRAESPIRAGKVAHGDPAETLGSGESFAPTIRNSRPTSNSHSSPPSSSGGYTELAPVVHRASSSFVPTPHFGNRASGTSDNDGGSTSTAKPLLGRVALVTGSGHGVGQTTARVLASRGATVIINSFHSREQGEQTAAEINQSGGSAIHIWGSVANPRQVDQIFEQIEQQFGRLDILICNASDGRIGSFMELTLDDWDKAFRTNVTGHHQCAVKAAPLMQASGGGSIVTMSAVGSRGFIDGLGSQGVVKAAVETMTRYLACELGQLGIRVNCVAGGPVYGELLSKFPDARSTHDHWESITPDAQLCSPMDLANAIAFLVSDEAKGVNGAVWMVDHGFSAMEDGRPIRAKAQEGVVFAS